MDQRFGILSPNTTNRQIHIDVEVSHLINQKFQVNYIIFYHNKHIKMIQLIITTYFFEKNNYYLLVEFNVLIHLIIQNYNTL